MSIQIYPRQRVAVSGQCHLHDALHPTKNPVTSYWHLMNDNEWTNELIK